MLAGCGSSTESAVITHDACESLVLSATSATASQVAALDMAQAWWRDRGAPNLGSGEAVEVRFEPAADPFHGLYEDGIIYINDSLTDAMPIVIAHELGHALGLRHVTDRTSVMNPGNLTTTPTGDDQLALETLWGTCN